MADIAHELRTPLTVMQGQLEGILDGVYPRDDERLNEVLEQARAPRRGSSRICGRSAHAETRHARAGERTDRPGRARGRHGGELRRRGRRERGGDRVVHGAAGTPAPAADPFVTADPIRIREVMINLLSNALRHTPRGGAVTIAIAPRRDAVDVSVRDTGAGIAPDALPRIFDRFYKGAVVAGLGPRPHHRPQFHRRTRRRRSRPRARSARAPTITFTLPIAAPA